MVGGQPRGEGRLLEGCSDHVRALQCGEEDQVPEEERVSVSVEAHNDMISVFQKNPVSETAADLLMLKEKHGLVTREINWWFIRVREMTRALDLEEEQLPEFFDKFNQKHTRDGVVSF